MIGQSVAFPIILPVHARFIPWKEVVAISLFAIADLHLPLGADKPMDIFSGWDHYVERLEKNWKNLVWDRDTIVLPGDISWALKLEEALPDFAFLHALPGKKLILKGNHDLWWCTMAKMRRFLLENGFTDLDFIHNNAVVVGEVAVCGTRGWFFDDADAGDRKVLLREAGRLDASITAAKATGKEPVAFLHYPPVCGGKVCREIFDVVQRHGISRVYYGHIHGAAIRQAFEGEFEGVQLRLISADKLGFMPILVD